MFCGAIHFGSRTRLPEAAYFLPAGTNPRHPRLSAIEQSAGQLGEPQMATASYYRGQADLLLSWTITTTDPAVADWLSQRAHDYLILARTLDDAEAARTSEPGYSQPDPGDCQVPSD